MEHEHPHPTGPTFDTLKAAEALQKAGFTGAQAKAVTQTVVAAQDNLASKADIRALRAEIMAEFKEQRAEMANLRADNKRVLDAFEAHIKVLRADNTRLEETLQAEMKSLREGISTLRWLTSLALGGVISLALGIAGISIALARIFSS